MNIIITDTQEVVQDCLKLTDRKEITKSTRLFFALGTYTERNNRGWIKESWRRSGFYKEITDPFNFAKHDKSLEKAEYIEHHNFVIKNFV
jgi:hypothetical protein